MGRREATAKAVEWLGREALPELQAPRERELLPELPERPMPVALQAWPELPVQPKRPEFPAVG
jgi:hypothetical protein